MDGHSKLDACWLEQMLPASSLSVKRYAEKLGYAAKALGGGLEENCSLENKLSLVSPVNMLPDTVHPAITREFLGTLIVHQYPWLARFVGMLYGAHEEVVSMNCARAPIALAEHKRRTSHAAGIRRMSAGGRGLFSRHHPTCIDYTGRCQ